MLAYLKTLFRPKAKGPCCPVCQNTNYVETPFEGTVTQGVIGYDRQFECGFATHWRGYRVKLCTASHPHPVAQAVAAVTPAARRMANGVGNGIVHIAP